MTPFPEYWAVLHDLIWSLSLHILSDVIDVISSILLIGLDKLIEITLCPICETLVNEVQNGKHEIIPSLSKQQYENSYHLYRNVISNFTVHVLGDFGCCRHQGTSRKHEHRFLPTCWPSSYLPCVFLPHFHQLFFVFWLSFHLCEHSWLVSEVNRNAVCNTGRVEKETTNLNPRHLSIILPTTIPVLIQL